MSEPSSTGAPAEAAALIDRLNGDAPKLSLGERLSAIAAAIPGRIVLTTSFGIEDQALTHAIAGARLDRIALATLDTGRLFPETYTVWAETQERYGLPIIAYFPRPDDVETLIARDGPDGFYRSPEARKACCNVRKVLPLARALAGAEAWITGLRGDQSTARSTVAFAAWDGERRLFKFNPLFDWTRDQVATVTSAAEVPVNALHGKGFLSIGCAPCTRALAPGEPERAGRWWWEEETAKECGLHLDENGRLVRIETAPKPDRQKEVFL